LRGSVFRKIAGVAAFVLLGGVAYLCFWPVPAEPVSWQAPTPPGFTGAYAPNTRLAGLRMIDTGNEIGPEHIAIGKDGKVYAAMSGGNLIRLEPDGSKQAMHWWAHELQHIVQYNKLGVDGFASEYIKNYKSLETEAEAKADSIPL
jgi:outer membrane protein assembly factor BamB